MQKKKSNNKILFKLVSIVLLIIVIFFFNQYAVENDVIKELAAKFGYFGVFIAAAISGFNLIIPIPIITFLPFFVESGLNTTILIFLIAIGMTVGDSIGYWLGKVGREVLSKKAEKWSKKIENMPKLGVYMLLLLYAAFAPLPNELIVIPMALLGFRFRYMFFALLLGNLVFNIIAGNSVLVLFNFL